MINNQPTNRLNPQLITERRSHPIIINEPNTREQTPNNDQQATKYSNPTRTATKPFTGTSNPFPYGLRAQETKLRACSKINYSNRVKPELCTCWLSAKSVEKAANQLDEGQNRTLRQNRELG